MFPKDVLIIFHYACKINNTTTGFRFSFSEINDVFVGVDVENSVSIQILLKKNVVSPGLLNGNIEE